MEKKTLNAVIGTILENACDQLLATLDAADNKICNLEKENKDLKLRIKGLEADIKGMCKTPPKRKKSNVILITTRFELNDRKLAVEGLKLTTDKSEEFIEHYVDHAMNQTLEVESSKAEKVQALLQICGIYTKIVS